jgi:protein tyrosine phosphatase (PTP) superfamily phosphohydrolase (DUF442 family)
MRRESVFLCRIISAAIAVPLCAALAFASDNGTKTVAIVRPTVTDSMGPMKIANLKIKNFGVADGRIYRGEQPSKDEYAHLAAMGIKVVIDLRLDAKKFAKASAEAAGMKYVNIPIDDAGMPTDADASAFLKAVAEAGSDPVYVHCAGGRHRTGSMIAVYRMQCDDWNVEQAYQEMLDYDFYTAWGHEGFKTYVFDFYRRKLSDPTSVPAPATVAAAASH